MKSVCTASLEEGHKHGVVRTPQEEGEALGREEVRLHPDQYPHLHRHHHNHEHDHHMCEALGRGYVKLHHFQFHIG